MKYGWRRDLPDQRDYQVSVSLFRKLTLPNKIDLRPQMPPVYDQLALGACTSNAVAATLDFERGKQGEQTISPSRLFVYYNERVDQGTTKSDSGASIRESIKTVAKLGACPESEWPYDITKYTQKPVQKCYTDALNNEALIYASLKNTLSNIKGVLASGMVVNFGFTVYESFESDVVTKTGIVPMPKPSEQVLGGHAVVCVGYDNSKGFIVRNSWGSSWGISGYCYMPYKYLTGKLASDFWVIKKVK
jgi:C1A family cysteine protease